MKLVFHPYFLHPWAIPRQRSNLCRFIIVPRLSYPVHTEQPSHVFASLRLSASKQSLDPSDSVSFNSKSVLDLNDEPPPAENLSTQVGSPIDPFFSRFNFPLTDQASVLITIVAMTVSVGFTGLVIATVQTLFAMRKAANALGKLADTAREELPSTMAAIRLSGMEISDLTLELSDLSQEIAEGVNKSTQAVQAAEAGIRQIGALAHHRTMSMIEERANLPAISIKPVVAGAAKKTSDAVGQATKTLMNMISRGDEGSDQNKAIDRVES